MTELDIRYREAKKFEAGLAKGKEEGRAEGRAEGMAEGEAGERRKNAKRMKEKGYSVKQISEITDLTADEVEEL